MRRFEQRHWSITLPLTFKYLVDLQSILCSFMLVRSWELNPWPCALSVEPHFYMYSQQEWTHSRSSELQELVSSMKSPLSITGGHHERFCLQGDHGRLLLHLSCVLSTNHRLLWEPGKQTRQIDGVMALLGKNRQGTKFTITNHKTGVKISIWIIKLITYKELQHNTFTFELKPPKQITNYEHAVYFNGRCCF